MVSNIDTAKRAFVTLLKSIAVIYGLVAGLTRESTDVQVRAAYKKVSRTRSPWVRTKHLPAQGSTWSHLVLGFELSGVPVTGHHFLCFSVQNSASPFRKFIGFLNLGLLPPSPLESCQNKFRLSWDRDPILLDYL